MEQLSRARGRYLGDWTPFERHRTRVYADWDFWEPFQRPRRRKTCSGASAAVGRSPHQPRLLPGIPQDDRKQTGGLGRVVLADMSGDKARVLP